MHVTPIVFYRISDGLIPFLIHHYLQTAHEQIDCPASRPFAIISHFW